MECCDLRQPPFRRHAHILSHRAVQEHTRPPLVGCLVRANGLVEATDPFGGNGGHWRPEAGSVCTIPIHSHRKLAGTAMLPLPGRIHHWCLFSAQRVGRFCAKALGRGPLLMRCLCIVDSHRRSTAWARTDPYGLRITAILRSTSLVLLNR